MLYPQPKGIMGKGNRDASNYKLHVSEATIEKP
jgi:hypothetical protein